MWGKYTAPVTPPPAHMVPTDFLRSFYYWMEIVDEDRLVAEKVYQEAEVSP